MRILILFAGIGGNRTLWGNKHYITAIENNEKIATIYRTRFPNDHVFVTDAYNFLEDTYMNYDFIYGGPPCFRNAKSERYPNHKPRLPDLRLYEIVIFLQTYYEGNWVIENATPYYKPPIKPTVKLGRHLFWSNMIIPRKRFKSLYKGNYLNLTIDELCKIHKVDRSLIDGFNPKDWPNHDPKSQILRNCVDFRIGKYILDQVKSKKKQKTLIY